MVDRFSFAVQSKSNRELDDRTLGKVASPLRARGRETLETVLSAPITLPYAAINTVGGSLENISSGTLGRGIKFFDTDIFNEESEKARLRSVADMTGIGALEAVSDNFDKHYAGINTTADVALLFTGAGAITKGTKGVGVLKGLGNTQLGRKVFGDFTEVEKRLDDLHTVGEEVAKKHLGLTTGVTSTSRTLEEARKASRDALFNLKIVGKNRKPLGASFKEALGTEAAIAVFMNESEFLFPESMNYWDYAQMGAVGLGLPVGIDILRNANAVRKINKSLGQTAFKAARAGVGLTADSVLPSEQLFMTTVIKRGVEAAEAGAGTPSLELTENAAKLQNTANAARTRATNVLGNVVDDDLGFKPARFTNAQIETVGKTLDKSPEKALGIINLESHVVGINPVDRIFTVDSVLKEKLDTKIKALQEETRTASQDIELQVLSGKRELLNNTIFEGYLQDGTVINRKLTDAFDGLNSPAVKINKNGSVNLGKGFTKADPKERHLRVTTAYAKAAGEIETRVAKLGDEDSIRSFLEKSVEGDRTYVDDDVTVRILDGIISRHGKDVVSSGLRGSKKLGGAVNVKDLEEFRTRLQARSFKKKLREYGNGKLFAEFDAADLSRHFNLNLHQFEGTTTTNLGEYFVQARRRLAGDVNRSIAEYEDDFRAFTRQALNSDDVSDVEVGLDFAGGNFDIAGTPVVAQIDNRVREPFVEGTRDLVRTAEASQAQQGADVIAYGELADETLKGLNMPNIAKIVDDAADPETVRLFREAVEGINPAAAANTGNNDTALGNFAAGLIPQDQNFRNRDIDAFGLGRSIEKQVRGQLERGITDALKPLAPVFDAIRSKKNLSHGQSYEVTVRSFNQGWDITKGSDFEQGKLKIDHTPKNRDILRRYGVTDSQMDTLFSKGPIDLPDITHLLKGRYQPVGITDLASQALKGISKVERGLKVNRNVVNGVKKQAFLDEEVLSLPSSSSQYEKTVLIHEIGTNKIVKVINAKTTEKALELAEAEAKVLNGGRLGAEDASVISKTATQFKAETGMSPSSQGIKVDGAAESSLLPLDTREMIDNMLANVIKDGSAIAADITRAKLAREMNFLDFMENSLRNADVGVNKGFSRNTFTDIKNGVLGLNGTSPQNQLNNRLLNLADDGIDKTLKAVGEQLDPFFATVRGRPEKAQAALDDLGKLTGYRPADTFMKAAGLSTNLTTEKIVRRFNGFSAFWMLQFAELGQAALNFTSIPTILPSVVSLMARRAGESDKAYGDRVGPWASIGPSGEPKMSPMKIMMQGTHDLFTKEGSDILAHARELGFLNAETSEVIDVLSGVKGVADDTVWKKIKNVMTAPTQISENISRTVSYLSGFRLAKAQNPDVTNDVAHKFANHFADLNVGDYSKINKPDQFRGGVGSALGLFQTFATNYWQRFARAIEQGDNKTVLTQLGTQFGMFGVESLPGYDVFNSAWTSYDGTQSPWESLVASYGVEGAEFMANGSLASLTGISLQTRGDTNLRGIPNLTNLRNVPAHRLVGNVLKSSRDIASLVAQEGTNTSVIRALEIANAGLPSRPASRAGEIAFGRAVDKNNALITTDTRSFNSVVARLVGSKPLDEQRVGAMMYRQRGIQQTQKRRSQIMRNNAVTKIRSDGMSKELVDEIFMRFLAEGGNPKSFKRFMVELDKKARISKSDREMLKAMKSIANGSPSKYVDRKMLKLYQLAAPDITGFNELRAGE